MNRLILHPFTGAIAAALLLGACSSNEEDGVRSEPSLVGNPGAVPAPGTADDPRAALRAASIFQNLDFEDVDEAGVPRGWTCACGSEKVACKTSSKAAHGTRSLALGPGCFALQDVQSFDRTKGIRFDGFVSDGAVFPGDVGLAAVKADGTMELVGVEGVPVAKPAWTAITSQGPVPSAASTWLRLFVMNSNGALDGVSSATPMTVDDLVVVQDGANLPPKAGALLHASHVEHFAYRPAVGPASLYVPLPLDWATQTPLWFELNVTPSSIVDHVTYATETNASFADPMLAPATPNWGATITFVPGASAEDAVIRWDAIALTRDATDAERAELFAADGPVEPWLHASKFVDAAYPGIASTAKGLVPASSTSLEKMAAVLRWTSSSIHGGPAKSLDATEVFDTRASSCTGFANLAAAMGRALAVPTRHVTNVLVGVSQQMHSIDEFYLGPSLGWRRVEPQAPSLSVAEDYGFILRLVVPAEENAVANRDSIGGPLVAGIPFREFTETLTGAEHFGYSTTFAPSFTDCAGCTDHADRIAILRPTERAAMSSMFAAARAAWQRDLATYASGGALDDARLAARRRAMGARSFEDVRAIVESLR